MTTIEEFVENLKPNQREIVAFFHQWLVDDLDLIFKMKYKIPFYYRNSWICYLNPTKNQQVELAFVRGDELSNIQGLLYRRNRKQVAGIEFTSVKDIPEQMISNIIHEALLLDETVPYKSKRKK